MSSRIILFGVWIPAQGWLRVKRDSGEVVPYAEEVKEIAQEVAHNIGMGAHVKFIDSSIAALQDIYLAQEQKTWRYKIWHTLTSSKRSSRL